MSEKVDHPAHYGGDTVYEHIKVAEAWGLNYALGNATKYICRAGKKTDSQLEDLKKAIWYLQHEVDRLQAPKRVMTGPEFERELIKHFTEPQPAISNQTTEVRIGPAPRVMRAEKPLFEGLPVTIRGDWTPSEKMCAVKGCIGERMFLSPYCAAHRRVE